MRGLAMRMSRRSDWWSTVAFSTICCLVMLSATSFSDTLFVTKATRRLSLTRMVIPFCSLLRPRVM